MRMANPDTPAALPGADPLYRAAVQILADVDRLDALCDRLIEGVPIDANSADVRASLARAVGFALAVVLFMDQQEREATPANRRNPLRLLAAMAIAANQKEGDLRDSD
jgi:hypothetical protein